MKNLATVIVGLLTIAFLLAYLVTFQVNYNQVVVVDTFGRADADSVYSGRADHGSLGNLHLKWPAPIQNVTRYDARVQILETQPEQTQTLDKYAIVPSLYVAWRIDDALKFHKQVRGDVREAEQQITARLRNAQTEIARYAFDQLTNSDPRKLKLADAEQSIRQNVQRSLRQPVDYGITVEEVGIKRLVLPEQVVEKVFAQMRSHRETLAEGTKRQGESQAVSIRTEAETASKRILDFASVRAAEVRAEGEQAAADVYQQFKQDPDFAIFQRKLDALREMLRNQATILADPRMVPFDEFARQQKPEGNPTTAPANAK
ncbi:MAG: SPFH domain-containing protein [Phycisphaerales bacterium]